MTLKWDRLFSQRGHKDFGNIEMADMKKAREGGYLAPTTLEPKKLFPFSAVIATASFIVAILALIPAFLSLNKEKPDLHYSYILSHYKAPDGIKEKLFTEFLTKNKIPTHRIALQIKNAGNAPSKVVKLSVETPGSIVRYIYNPSQEDNPVWVALPANAELGFGHDINKIIQTFQALSPNRLLIFCVGYEGESEQPPKIELFGDAVEAKFVPSISEVQPWSPYRVFYIPGYILAAGLLLTLLWIVCSVIYSNPYYRNIITDVLSTTATSFIGSLPVAIVVKSISSGLNNPKLSRCRATLRIAHARNRSCDAEALVVNPSARPCHVTDIRLRSDVFDLDTICVSFNHEVAYGFSGRGNELPLRLAANESKHVYMRTKELTELYEDPLPETVELYVYFDSFVKPLCKTLTRDGDRSVYKCS